MIRILPSAFVQMCFGVAPSNVFVHAVNINSQIHLIGRVKRTCLQSCTKTYCMIVLSRAVSGDKGHEIMVRSIFSTWYSFIVPTTFSSDPLPAVPTILVAFHEEGQCRKQEHDKGRDNWHEYRSLA